MYNPFSLNGKTVLVTGASSGIGRSIAVECSRIGADVILTGRNVEQLNQTLALMEIGCHVVVSADLSDETDIARLVDLVPEVNGVVHCAGVGKRTICKMIKEADLDFVLKPNLYGPILLQRHLLKMKKIAKEASIVFIASSAPYAPAIGNGIYSASKGAILGYANCLGLELAPQKIRVNSICPAMVLTEFVEKDALEMGVDYQALQLKYPLKRYGKPKDVAYLTIYLLSDASSWMTGTAIDLTGGAKGL